MSALLREHQHEMFLLSDPSRAIVFGTEDTGMQTSSPPSISDGETRSQDAAMPAADGIQFGIDYVGAKTMSFEFNALAPLGSSTPQADVEDTLAAFEGAWRDERFRTNTQAIAVLRSKMAGRQRRCYGRPRRYADTPTMLLHQGYVPASADFQLIDDRWYDDDALTVKARPIVPQDTGLMAPLMEPLVAVGESVSPLLRIIVGGSRPTWPVATFVGPSINPRVQIGPLVLSLITTIAYDQALVVDPSPWIRSVYRRSDGADFGGVVDPARTPPLARCALSPGTHTVVYTATDPTASSYVDVTWRAAHSRP